MWWVICCGLKETFGVSVESCPLLQFGAVTHPSSGLHTTSLASACQAASNTWTLKGRDAADCAANALVCEGTRGTQDHSDKKLKQQLWDLTEILSVCRSRIWVRRLSNEAADPRFCIENILLKLIRDDQDRWICSITLLIWGHRNE